MKSFLLALLFVLLTVSTAHAQHDLTFEEIKEVAIEAVEQQQFKYEIPAIAYNSQIKTIWWAWGNFLLPTERPIDLVVEAQARVEVFRLGYATFGDAWESLSQQNEERIRNKMLQIAYDKKMSDKEKTQWLKYYQRLNFYTYEKALNDWADQNGWSYQSPQSRAGAYDVTIVSNPRRAQIKVAHIVRYRVALLEEKDPATVMTHVVDGSRFIWTGEHVVAARFPDGRVLKPEKANVGWNGIVTVTPDGLTFKIITQ
jgi:hypothetical protein